MDISPCKNFAKIDDRMVKMKSHRNDTNNIDIGRNKIADKVSIKGSNKNASTEKFLNVSDIELVSFRPGIDKGIAVVKEVSNNLLIYEYPNVRAVATVKIPPLPKGVNIQVGWIQVVTKFKQVYIYGNKNFLSWQIPELENGEQKMISDSATKHFPWYDDEEGISELKGPTGNYETLTVEFNDAPDAGTITFMPDCDSVSDASLNFVYRKQRFYTYLVLKNVNEDRYQIIKAFTWILEVEIGMDPEKPLGERVAFVYPCKPLSPVVLSEKNTPPLEDEALKPPSVNDCQILVGRYRYGPLELFKEPDEPTVDIDKYLLETEDQSMKLYKLTKKNFLLLDKPVIETKFTRNFLGRVKDKFCMKQKLH